MHFGMYVICTNMQPHSLAELSHDTRELCPFFGVVQMSTTSD